MDETEARYRKRTGTSRKLFDRGRQVIPGGVSHGIRLFSPYPFYVQSAAGAHLTDVDGAEYVDFWIGHFALLLGHSHPVVVAALTAQLERGTQWGTPHAGEVELAEIVCDAVPCAETVRLCNSGAEATMYAVRLARGITGRQRVLKAEGGWHGFCTDLLHSVHGPFHQPESLGLPPALARDVDTFAFNDVASLRGAFRGDPVAAVIVEPVLGAGGAVPAETEFLQALREETEAHDALLIFDEVITGFRLALGGAQEYFGVQPDLVTLGKILGGGVAIGALAGAREFMEWTTPGREGGGVSIGGGTFSANPLATAAGLATLRYLQTHRTVYDDLARRGATIRRTLPTILKDAGVLALCTGVASLFQVHFPLAEGVTIRSARDVAEQTDPRRREEGFKLALVNEGVFTVHGGGALSVAHTDADVDRLREAVAHVAGRWRGTGG